MPQFTHARPLPAKALRKPRNPLVAPCAQRLAGRHRGPDARQAAQAQLRRSLHALHPPHDTD